MTRRSSGSARSRSPQSRNRGSVPWLHVCRDPAAMQRRISAAPVRCPQDAYALLRSEAGIEDQECFYVILLNVAGYARGIELVHRGTMTGMVVHPREVYRLAVATGADAIICAHNHPSGTLKPSDSDKQLTSTLRAAGEILGITLADHLIVTAKGFYSLAKADELG